MTPLQKRLRKLPAPHGSLALPAQAWLHDDAGAVVALASVALPQKHWVCGSVSIG